MTYSSDTVSSAGIDPRLVVITRPRDDAAELIRSLKDGGVAVISEPSIRIVALPSFDTLSTDDAPSADDTHGASPDALVFTSANGVRVWYGHRHRSSERDSLQPLFLEGLPIYAIGSSTARVAREARPHARVIAADGTPDGLFDLIRQTLAQGSRLIHLGGTRVGAPFGTRLKQAGYRYRHVAIYRTDACDHLSDRAVDAYRNGRIVAQVFYSVYSLHSHVRRSTAHGVDWQAPAAICWSGAIASVATQLGHRRVSHPDAMTHDSMVRHIVTVVSAGSAA